MQNKKMAELTWPEIEFAFKKNWIVVIPLGAVCKEHGYHLPMNTDLILAEKLADHVQANYQNILIAPSITESYFPSFTQYPGSCSLTLNTATNLIVQRCALWYQQGAKRFYVINNGVSTNQPLKLAKATLEKSYLNLQLEYLDLASLHEDPRIKSILKQKRGTHADELETSIMMHIAPHLVQLEKAIPEANLNKPGPLTRDVNATDKTISISGVWGDPTLACKEKGEIGLMILQELIDSQLHSMGAQNFAIPIN
ncbi:MAG: creatininase family protein [Proteobacteria bacterium]|nr:creatininase family protein [Pseudomonadota bacterium]